MGPQTGGLSCPLLLLFFFGFLEESSPHASLEASSARFVARRVRFYSDLMAHGDDVDGARAANLLIDPCINLLCSPIRGSRSVPELPAADGTAVRHQRTQDGGTKRQDLRQLSKQALRLEARDDARARARSPGITAPALRRPAQLRGPARRHG